MKTVQLLLIGLLAISCKQAADQTIREEWIPLFNGKDLSGWDIKISGYPLNENYMDIFRVEDSILKVSYDKLDSFRGEFGHLFYREKFSHYKLRVEYRFTGEQRPGGPEWAIRNSGAMLHSQSAASMQLNQDFPVSIEAQFLGGLGEGNRPTANVCTPGTDIDMLGAQVTDHCTQSRSATFLGDQWVTVELVVRGDSIIHHVIGTDTVLTYTRPRVGIEMAPEGYPVPAGTLLNEGYIALQAESHNVEFRKVELLKILDP